MALGVRLHRAADEPMGSPGTREHRRCVSAVRCLPKSGAIAKGERMSSAGEMATRIGALCAETVLPVRERAMSGATAGAAR